MSEIRYRNASPSDAAALSQVGRQTFTETFGHLYTAENLAAFLVGHTEENWAEELRDPDVKVRLAEADGLIAAYAKLSSPTLPIELPGPAAELRQFYVLQQWHGKGVAHELMRWAIGEAKRRRAESLYLSVFVDNHRARRFYERYGFEFVAPYAFMVGTHADEDHILRLRLETE